MSQESLIEVKLSELATEKINVGKVLLEKLNHQHNTDEAEHGFLKLKRKIESEIKFLNKKLEKKELKSHHILCSNINQLSALVDVATSLPGVNSVLRTFDKDDKQKITVDVVGEGGLNWYKVILRDPKALHQIFKLGGKNGVRSIKSVGQDFIQTAKLHPYFFTPPKVCFIFVKGVSSSLATSLQEIDIEIQGNIIEDKDLCVPDYNVYSSDDDVSVGDQENDFENITSDIEKVIEKSNMTSVSSYKIVNLDVTCLIAYVSATSNGGCNFTFQDDILTEQANLERANPVKIILDNYFEGRNLIVCEPAAKHFQTIVDTIGGDMEKERGSRLLKRCIIIDECKDILEGKLKIGGKVKQLSRLIFSTGIYHQAPTITSNKGFIRSAKNQGINIAALLHEPRALTEQKESKATPVESSDIII